jgi:two-component system sensor histidine kinase UhpB
VRKPSRSAWRGLAPQLLITVILPLAALLVAVAYGGLRMHQEEMLSLAGERDVKTVVSAVNTLEALLQQRPQTVENLAWSAKAGASEPDLITSLNLSGSAGEAFDGGLAFINPTADRILATANQDFWQNLPDQTLQELAKQAGAAGSPVADKSNWSRLLPTQDGQMLFILRPSASGWSAAGAFSPTSVIETALAPIIYPEQEIETFVVDRKAGLLYQFGAGIAPDDALSHPGVAEAWNGKYGTTFIETQGHDHVVAYAPLASQDWAIVIEEPWHTVASPMLRATENAPLIPAPVVLFSLLALWLATRRIVQPLQALEAKAAQVGWGKFEAIEEPVGGILEIRNLQAELIHLAHKVRTSQEGLRSYIGAMTLGQEEERRRLARELHDDTLQTLIALNQRLQLTALNQGENSAAQPADKKIAELQALAEQTIQDLRRFTRALRPIYLEELGLSAALEMLARETGKGQDVKISFTRLGVEQRLPPQAELALYRIAQETLSNVLRHAQAQFASLTISYTPEMISLEIRDDGRGFEVPESPASFAPGGHFGLLGLHERAEMIGAQLAIESAPGKGTRVTIILPSNEHPEERPVR